MWFHDLSQLSSVHIRTSAGCHHTVHSWGVGLSSFMTILYCHSTLLSLISIPGPHSASPWGLRRTRIKASLKSGLARVLLGIACTPMAGGLGNLTVYHPVVEGGWGARKEEEAAFVKRYCSARGKVPLKAACPISWGSRTRSPGDRAAPVFAQVSQTKPYCEVLGTVLC